MRDQPHIKQNTYRVPVALKVGSEHLSTCWQLHFPGPTPKPAEMSTYGGGAQESVLRNPLGDSDSCYIPVKINDKSFKRYFLLWM